MKTIRPLFLCTGLLLSFCAREVQAGQMYLVTLKGVVYQTNTAGNIIGTTTTHSTILQDISERSGLPVTNLALVYHVGGNVMGDTLDVIDRAEGRVLDTLFGFYFGEAFARRALYNVNGTDQRRLDYLYTRQAGVALGSSIVSKRQVRIASGTTRTLVQGSMQWIVMPENQNPAQICTAKFITSTLLNP